MQRKRDSDSSGQLEPRHKLSQPLLTIEATTSPQQQEQNRKDKTQLQTEVAQLYQQLEEARRKIKAQGQVAIAVQRRFKDCLGQIQAGTLEQVQMTEDRNKKLASRNADLLELLQVERTERGSTLSCLQRALSETQRDLASCEDTLEARGSNRDVTEEEKQHMQGQGGWLEGRLRESEEDNVQLRQSLRSLRFSRLYKDDKVVATNSKQSQEASSQTQNVEETTAILKLMESVQKLQTDNGRLGEALKWQSGKMAELQESEAALAKVAGLEQQLVQKARLEEAEEEASLLRGRLEEAQNMAKVTECQLADVRKYFDEAFGKMRIEAVKMAAANQQLQELREVERSAREQETSEREQERSEREQERSERELERSGIESYMMQLQQELAEARREVLSKEEAQGGSSERYKKLEEENLEMQRYIGRLEGTLMERESKCAQAEQQIVKLVGTLGAKDREVCASAQKLQEVFEASACMDETIQLLRESMQRLESDTFRQEEVVNEQASRITELEKEINEVARVKRDLEERLGWEMQAQVQLIESEAALQVERKKFNDTQEIQQDLQAQLEQVQSEGLTLRQQLEDSLKTIGLKDQALKDMQDFVSGARLFKSFSEDKVLLVEDKSTDVVAPENTKSQDLVDCTNIGQDNDLTQLQKKLVDMQMKLSMCEELLEEKTLCCKDLASKNQVDLDRLKGMLLESEDKLIQSEYSNSVILEEDIEVTTFPQNTKEVVSVDTAETAESLCLLESENARLEESLRQQVNRIKELEEEVNVAARVKRDLEERLDQEIQRQSSLNVNPQVEVSDTEVTQQDKQNKFSKAPNQQLQAQLDNMKIDRLVLQQQWREAQKMSELRDLAVMDMQRCMNDTLEGMQLYSQERIDLAERRCTVLASDIAQLQEQLECMTADRDSALGQLQKELVETRHKLSLCDKTLRYGDLEERLVSQEYLTTLTEVLQQTDDKYVQLERYNFNLPRALEDKTFSQKPQELPSTSKDTDKTVQLLVTENLRLEEALKQHAGRISELEKEVNEAVRVKRDLEERLTQDMARLSSLSVNAQLQVTDIEADLQDEGRNFSEDAFSGLQAYSKEIQLAERKSQVFVSKVAALQERIEPVKADNGRVVSQLQKELAEMRQKLSLCKESLEDKALQCRELEEEKLLIREDLNTLKEVLQQTDDNYVQLERDNFNLTCALEDKEREDTGFEELQVSKSVDSESLVRDLQKEIADMQEKLSSCKELLELKTCSCRELEGEYAYVKKDMSMLRGILQETKERCLQSEQYNFNLKCALEDKEREVMALSLKLQEVVSAPTDLGETISPVDGSVQRLGSDEIDRDMQTQLSLCEELLEEASRQCTDLKEEKHGLQKDVSANRRMLQESEERQVQLERRIFELEGALDARGGAVISGRLEDFQEGEEASVMKEGFEDQSLIEALHVRVEREGVPLYRQLDVVAESEEVGEQVRRGVQYPFSSTLANTSADYSRFQPVENQDMDVQQPLGQEIPERERGLSQLPRELAGALELLELKIKKCRNLEEQVNMLKKMLEASERQNARLELGVQNLRSALDSAEQKVISTSLKLHQAVTSLSAAEKTNAQLEESVRQLEAENGKLRTKARRLADRAERAMGAQREAAGRTKIERSQLDDQVNHKVQRQISQDRKEALYTRQEEEKALTQMKARMEQLSPELQEDVGRSWSLEEENTPLGNPSSSLPAQSDSFKQVRSRRELEEEVQKSRRELDEEVRRSRRELDEEVWRGRGLEEERRTLKNPFSYQSERYKQGKSRSQWEEKMAASQWAGPSQRFN